MKPDFKRIGKRLKNVRKEAGLTQEAFGEIIGLSKNHVSDLERGVTLPSVKSLFVIYEHFKNTPNQILLGSKPPEIDDFTKKVAQLSPKGLRLLQKTLDTLLEEDL